MTVQYDQDDIIFHSVNVGGDFEERGQEGILKGGKDAERWRQGPG